jgi:hypothetical protein
MTLKIMQGFETMRDDADFRSQGWVFAPTKMYAAFAPAVTALPGFSLRQMGAFVNPNSTNEGAGADTGYLNTGLTPAQAWTAGGFTWGINAQFNSTNAFSFGGASSNNPNQVCFDGTLYWAMRLLGSASFTICTSPDLINWTPTSSQPAAGSIASALYFMGSGTVMFVPAPASAGDAGLDVFFTNNNGASWTSQNIPGVASAASNTTTGTAALATGNSAFPHLVCQQTNSTNAPSGAVSVGTLGGTFVKVGVPSNHTASASTTRARIFSGLIVVPLSIGANASSTVFSAVASSTSLNVPIGTAGTPWTAANGGAVGNINDIQFMPSSNLYVIATSAGIYTTPNPGATAGVPGQWDNNATITWSNRYSTTNITSLWLVGSLLVGIGIAGHIITSSDGITWTEQVGHIFPSAGPYNWTCSLFDGNQYVLFSDSTSGVVAVTPDLQTLYQVKYVKENPELAKTPQGQLGIVIAPNSTTGSFSPTDRINIQVAPVSAGSRVVTVNVGAGLTVALSTTLPVTGVSLDHYYELSFKSTSTTNTFNVTWSIDGTIIGTIPNFAFTGATNNMYLTLCRTGQFTAYDDTYLTFDDGLNVVGPLGVINIVARRPTTDQQAQFTRVGSAASNALSVNEPAASSNSPNSVQSTNSGDKDIYTSTDTIPAGFSPVAVQTEGYFSRISTTTPTLSIGKSLNGNEEDSPTFSVSSTTPVYQAQIFQNDPSGAKWTRTSVMASGTDVTHVT